MDWKQVIAQKEMQIQDDKLVISEKEMQNRAAEVERTPKDLRGALRADPKETAIIGGIGEPAAAPEDFFGGNDPVKLAREYQKAGINAVSVWTKEHYLRGGNEYVAKMREQIRIPILRRDFVIDPYQLYEALVIGADAVLLMVQLLDDTALANFFGIANTLGLQCVVEVRNEEDAGRVGAFGCKLAAINNLDFATGKCDIAMTKKLRPLLPSDCTVIAENGIETKEDVQVVRKYGAQAVLVSQNVLASGKEKDIVRSLRSEV